jgi:hypothetical protein
MRSLLGGQAGGTVALVRGFLGTRGDGDEGARERQMWSGAVLGATTVLGFTEGVKPACTVPLAASELKTGTFDEDGPTAAALNQPNGVVLLLLPVN